MIYDVAIFFTMLAFWLLVSAIPFGVLLLAMTLLPEKKGYRCVRTDFGWKC